MTARSLMALILVLTLSSSMLASGPVIGVAVSDGNFQVNNSPVSGSANLFEGATVQTDQFSSRLDLSAARVILGSNSRVRLARSSVSLEQGFGELIAKAAYRMEARSLRVTPEGPKAIARVQLDGAKKVLVEAVNGPVRVYNHTGLLVARVNPGLAFSFEPQAAAADAFNIQGCLLYKDGQYIVADPNGQIVEVRGIDLAGKSGNRVHVTGKAAAGTPVAGATQIVDIGTIEQTGTGGCLAVAQGAGAQLRPPGTSAAQTSPQPTLEKTGAGHAGVYAGVAVAAAAAGVVGIVAATRKGKS
jgi:hypothetical protein